MSVKKHSSFVVLLGHSLYHKVRLFKGERDKAFENEKKCKGKGFDLVYVGNNG